MTYPKGLGYRTAGARAMAASAFSLDVGPSVGALALRLGASPAVARGAVAIAGLATRGNIANLLAAAIAAWALQQIINNWKGGRYFPGLPFAFQCNRLFDFGPVGREPFNNSCVLGAGAPATVGLDDPYTSTEWSYGTKVQHDTGALHPSSVEHYDGIGPFTPRPAGITGPVVYPPGYFEKPVLPVNVMPGDAAGDMPGIVRGIAAGLGSQATPLDAPVAIEAGGQVTANPRFMIPPAIDGWYRPIGVGEGDGFRFPPPVFYWWQRYYVPAGEGTVERSERGYVAPPVAVGDLNEPVPETEHRGPAAAGAPPVWAIEVAPGRGIREIEHSRPLLKAGANVHERKIKTPSSPSAGKAAIAVAKKAFGNATEVSDLIEDIYNALPEELRKALWKINGRHDLGTAKQLEAIYKHYDQIDIGKMVNNITFDQLQDALIGKASSDIVQATGGSPLSMTLSRFAKLYHSGG